MLDYQRESTANKFEMDGGQWPYLYLPLACKSRWYGAGLRDGYPIPLKQDLR